MAPLDYAEASISKRYSYAELRFQNQKAPRNLVLQFRGTFKVACNYAEHGVLIGRKAPRSLAGRPIRCAVH